MKKRGISPLIATVLIIGFVIVVAILVIMFIQGQITSSIESQEETTDIASANVKTSALEYTCTGTNLQVLISNDGSVPIEGFVATVESGGSPQISNLDLGTPFAQYGQQRFDFTLSSNCPATIDKVTIDPKIDYNGELVVAKQGRSSTAVVGTSSGPSEICNNGIDDDGDTYADGADSDCTIGVYLNEGTDLRNCGMMCLDNGYSSCLSAGNDVDGTNGNLWVYISGSCDSSENTALGSGYATCGLVAGDNSQICSGYNAMWYRCRCSN
jgi:flagellin-like protein